LARLFIEPDAVRAPSTPSRSSVCHAACALRLKLIDLCVGVKSNGGTRSLYRSRHELVLYSAAAAVK
jgi:hypothetical protein